MTSPTGKVQRRWDEHAAGYDQQFQFLERRFFVDTRDWVCAQASGDVLEVAVGTGLNLGHYPADVRLTGIDLSPGMLAKARHRADQLGRRVELRTADAEHLPFPDASFDTVVCTYSLCGIPDERQALAEMARVLRPGGRLLLADHIEAKAWAGRLLQRLVELISVPLEGEHYRRRPLRHLAGLGLVVQRRDRFALGIIERLAATKPA
jgi:ubiquinone/menaquinone biosynthesis C-methylase UbiE